MAGTATPSATSDSGNTWLEGLLWGTEWSSGGATTISVYIAGQGGNETVALQGQTITAQDSIGQSEIDAMTSAMNAIASVCDVTFATVGDQASADIIWACVDDTDGQGALGWANPPGTAYSNTYSDYQSVVTVNQDAYVGASLAAGGYDYITFIHELGHAMGLAHPHDGGGGSTTFPSVSGPFGDTGTHDMNQGIFTMMSYNDGWQTAPHGSSVSADYGWQGTPMALDIAALQYMYGADMSVNAGATTYTMPSTNGSGTYYTCIWDGGGTDAIVGATSLANLIDLRAATLLDEEGGGGFVSYANGIHGGFTIANGVVIENATGGSAADAMFGNSAANVLDGGFGADIIDGDAGNDTLLGDRGADTLTGGAGNDSVAGGDDMDSIVGGAGNDFLDGGGAADTFFFEGLFGNDTLTAALDLDATDNVIRFGSLVTEAMISYEFVADDANILITVAGGSGGDEQGGTILIEGWATGKSHGGGFGSMVWTADGGGSVDFTGLVVPADPEEPEEPAEPEEPEEEGPIIGSNGGNRVDGTSGGDEIHALGGSDRAEGLAGNDTILGGSGYDTLVGGDGDDLLFGERDNDRLYGNGGADTIEGGAGNDLAEGGDGNDEIYGGNGKDKLYGGAGDDTLDGGAHKDRLYGEAGDDRLVGGAGNDKADGGEGNDVLVGDGGYDRMDGGLGDDTLDAGSGNDYLLGAAGADVISAGSGKDTLLGGDGDDTLEGGRHGDRFIFAGAFGDDVISDFEDTVERRQDNLDRIDLSAYRVFNGGILKMSDLLLTTSGADVTLELDLDSNGVADAIDLDGDAAADSVSILLEGVAAGQLSAHDFYF